MSIQVCTRLQLNFISTLTGCKTLPHKTAQETETGSSQEARSLSDPWHIRHKHCYSMPGCDLQASGWLLPTHTYLHFNGITRTWEAKSIWRLSDSTSSSRWLIHKLRFYTISCLHATWIWITAVLSFFFCKSNKQEDQWKRLRDKKCKKKCSFVIKCWGFLAVGWCPGGMREPKPHHTTLCMCVN